MSTQFSWENPNEEYEVKMMASELRRVSVGSSGVAETSGYPAISEEEVSGWCTTYFRRFELEGRAGPNQNF